MTKFVPSFEDYRVDVLRGFSVAELRREYTRMRDVAQKRVERLRREFPEAKAGQKVVQLFNDKGEVIKEYVGFRKLEDIHPNDLPKALSELAKFVNAKTSTVTGQRATQAKTMATLNKAIGADEEARKQPGVTKQNYWRVIKILEESRRRKVTYDSSKIVSLAETTLSFTDDQFDVVLDKLEKLIPNTDEVEESLSDYMNKRKIQDFQRVNVDDFIEQLGW